MYTWNFESILYIMYHKMSCSEKNLIRVNEEAEIIEGEPTASERDSWNRIIKRFKMRLILKTKIIEVFLYLINVHTYFEVLIKC